MIRSMRISTVLIVTGLCLLLGSPASALFEELSVSPRALAMGEAGVAVSGDGNYITAGSDDGNVYFFSRDGTDNGA